MKTLRHKEKIYFVILFLVFILTFANNNYVINLDTSYLRIDSAEYFYKSLQFADIINSQSSLSQKVKEIAYNFIYENPTDKSPLFVLTLLPFYHLIGVSADAALISMSFYNFILIFSIYFLGKKIKSKEVGLLSGISLSFLPSIAGASKTFVAILPMCCFVLLTLYFYLKSNYFENRKYSILCGLFFGLGMLTKYEFFLFVLPWMLFDIKNIKRQNKSALKNITFALAIAFVIFSPWYFLNVNVAAVHLKSGDIGIIKSNDFTFYLKQANNFYFGKLLFPIMAVFFIYFILKIKNKYKKNLVICITFPLIIFTLFMGLKVSHYMTSSHGLKARGFPC